MIYLSFILAWAFGILQTFLSAKNGKEKFPLTPEDLVMNRAVIPIVFLIQTLIFYAILFAFDKLILN